MSLFRQSKTGINHVEEQRPCVYNSKKYKGTKVQRYSIKMCEFCRENTFNNSLRLTLEFLGKPISVDYCLR